jgi:hypothetical protein
VGLPPERQFLDSLAPHLAGLVQRHDVRVLQASHRLGLDQEAQPLGGAGVFDRPDHLQGDEAVGLVLAGAIDDAHAAVAADPENLVAGHSGYSRLSTGVRSVAAAWVVHVNLAGGSSGAGDGRSAEVVSSTGHLEAVA